MGRYIHNDEEIIKEFRNTDLVISTKGRNLIKC